jgi:hypothetical protein
MNIGVAPKAIGKNPFTVFCYLCGREYGSKSIEIHEPICLEKWKSKNNALPKKMQKPLPNKPKALNNEPLLPGKASYDPYNTEAMHVYSEASRHACRTCERQFLIESLEKHEKVCKPGGYFDRHRVKKAIATSN